MKLYHFTFPEGAIMPIETLHMTKTKREKTTDVLASMRADALQTISTIDCLQATYKNTDTAELSQRLHLVGELNRRQPEDGGTKQRATTPSQRVHENERQVMSKLRSVFDDCEGVVLADTGASGQRFPRGEPKVQVECVFDGRQIVAAYVVFNGERIAYRGRQGGIPAWISMREDVVFIWITPRATPRGCRHEQEEELARQRDMNWKLQDDLAYPPRAMKAERAAAYLDMSRSKFLGRVA